MAKMRSDRLFRSGYLSAIFYPPVCPMCGGYTGDVADRTEVICSACLDALPRTEQAELPENSTEMTLWGECRSPAAARRIMHLERAAAFLFYEKDHPLQRVIHKMKYADLPEIAWQLARLAAREFAYADFFENIDVIIPVPLHPNRLHSRGYNQSEYIARGLSDVTGIPVDTTHLLRCKDTPKQAQIKASGAMTSVPELRKANVADAFEVVRPEQLYHKHILLVDDLITTGETVRACLKAMKRFRGAEFTVFALCKAR